MQKAADAFAKFVEKYPENEKRSIGHATKNHLFASITEVGRGRRGDRGITRRG